jgi:hypothetical protein
MGVAFSVTTKTINIQISSKKDGCFVFYFLSHCSKMIDLDKIQDFT